MPLSLAVRYVPLEEIGSSARRQTFNDHVETDLALNPMPPAFLNDVVGRDEWYSRTRFSSSWLY